MRRFIEFVAVVLCYTVISINQVNGDGCLRPKATVTSFSTQDATILTQVAHIAQFKLKCDNDASLMPDLFAEFPCGRVVPIAQTANGAYQINWTEDIKGSTSGDVKVRIFDEEGYSTLRKMQRDAASTANVKSLLDITVNKKSAYKGPWVNAEIVAALVISSIAYFAVSLKGKVQS